MDGRTIALELKLDPGFSSGHADRGTKYLKRFLVPRKSSCNRNGSIVSGVPEHRPKRPLALEKPLI